MLTYKGYDFPENAAILDIERGKLDTLRLLPWQTDTSVSIHSWGYAKNDEYRSAKSLIDELVDVVSKNGNLLLNVGPKSDGTIPEAGARHPARDGRVAQNQRRSHLRLAPVAGLRRRTDQSHQFGKEL